MATRFAGQKIRFNYGGITNGAAGMKMVASSGTGSGPDTAKAGAEPLCTEFT